MILHILDGVARGLLAVLAIFLLRKIMRGSEFQFSFSFLYAKKAIFASTFIIIGIVIMIINMLNAAEINIPYRPLPTYVMISLLRNLSSGIFEEVWFRGLLMTAALYYYGNTVKGRLLIVSAASFLFGLGHFQGGLFLIIVTFIAGLAFSAAYAYSANLLILGVLHGLWNSAQMFGIHQSRNMALSTITEIAMISLFVPMIIFAIIITIRSEPFSKKMDRLLCLRYRKNN